LAPTKPKTKAHFLPSQKSACFEPGITFIKAALDLGILIESNCAGLGTCAKCKVRIQEGASALTSVEKSLLTQQEITNGIRLSCQAKLSADSVCLVPEESLLLGEQIDIEGKRGQFRLQPDIKKVFLQLPKPQLGQKYFDLEHVVSHLSTELGCALSYDFRLAAGIPRLLRENNFAVTATVDGNKLIDLGPGNTTDKLYGVAVDIGTTTLAAKLLDITTGEILAIAAVVNPQKSYGADVVSRINYTVENKGGLALLQRIIIKAINELIASLCSDAEITASDICKLVFTGNTVMQHLLLNVDPRNIAYKPYAPAFQGPVTLTAAEVGLRVSTGASVYVLPGLACFVGSDLTAVLTVLDLDLNDKLQLVVDIGTNGEIVFGCKDKLLCCSSPAGPAWEGATIAWGMRAAQGAIERAQIFDGELRYRTIGDAKPIGICGSGLLDLVSEFRRCEIIDKTGRILAPAELGSHVPEKLRHHIVPQENGANNLIIAEINTNKQIMLTQKDIREVQLAKSTIAAGIKILLQEVGTDAHQIENIYIAGAFGNHVRGKDAIDLGLIPGVEESRIHFIGNAALAGAEAVLLSQKARKRAESIAASVEYVEISEHPDFQEHFVGSMHFPEDVADASQAPGA